MARCQQDGRAARPAGMVGRPQRGWTDVSPASAVSRRIRNASRSRAAARRTCGATIDSKARYLSGNPILRRQCSVQPSGAGPTVASMSIEIPSLSLPLTANRVGAWSAVTRASSVAARPATRCSIRSVDPVARSPGDRRSTRTMPLAMSHVGHRSMSTSLANASAGGRAIATSCSWVIAISRAPRGPARGGTTARDPGPRTGCRSGGSARGPRGHGRRPRAAMADGVERALADRHPARRIGEQVLAPLRVRVRRDQERAIARLDEARRSPLASSPERRPRVTIRRTRPWATRSAFIAGRGSDGSDVRRPPSRRPSRLGRRASRCARQRARCQDLPSVWVEGA